MGNTVTTTNVIKDKGFNVRMRLNDYHLNHPYEVGFQNRISAQEWTDSLNRFNPVLEEIRKQRQKMIIFVLMVFAGIFAACVILGTRAMGFYVPIVAIVGFVFIIMFVVSQSKRTKEQHRKLEEICSQLSTEFASKGRMIKWGLHTEHHGHGKRRRTYYYITVFFPDIEITTITTPPPFVTVPIGQPVSAYPAQPSPYAYPPQPYPQQNYSTQPPQGYPSQVPPGQPYSQQPYPQQPQQGYPAQAPPQGQPYPSQAPQSQPYPQQPQPYAYPQQGYPEGTQPPYNPESREPS